MVASGTEKAPKQLSFEYGKLNFIYRGRADAEEKRDQKHLHEITSTHLASFAIHCC